MTLKNKRSFLLSSILAITAPTLTLAHGPNVELSVVNNQVVTNHFFIAPNQSYTRNGVTTTGENYNPLYVGQSVRQIEVPMVLDNVSGTGSGSGHNAINNNGWYGQPLSDGSAAFTGPGIAYGANTDAQGNVVSNGFTAAVGSPLTITETLTAPLMVWNGSAFVASTTDRLEGIRGSIGGLTATPLYTSPTGGESASWSTSQTALTPDSHNQVEWRLDTIGTETPDLTPADGIYLATLQISSNEATIPSLPFYFLYEKNAGSIDPATFSAEIAAAQATLPANSVPEPTTLGGLALLSLIFASRRKRPLRYAARFIKAVCVSVFFCQQVSPDRV